MERENYFNILIRGKRTNKKIKLKGIMQRVCIFLVLISTIIYLIAMIQSVYWQVFLKSDRINTVGLTTLAIWISAAIGIVAFDSYNPLKKIGQVSGDYNTQFFVLTELIIREIKISHKLNPYLIDLFQLQYRYICKLKSNSNSLYIFEDNETIKYINKLHEIIGKMSYSLFYNNKQGLLDLLDNLSNVYLCKVNGMNYIGQMEKMESLITSISNNGNLTKNSKSKKQNRYKKYLIAGCIIFIVIGLISTILVIKYPNSRLVSLINALNIGYSVPVTIILSFIAPEIINKWKH